MPDTVTDTGPDDGSPPLPDVDRPLGNAQVHVDGAPLEDTTVDIEYESVNDDAGTQTTSGRITSVRAKHVHDDRIPTKITVIVREGEQPGDDRARRDRGRQLYVTWERDGRHDHEVRTGEDVSARGGRTIGNPTHLTFSHPDPLAASDPADRRAAEAELTARVKREIEQRRAEREAERRAQQLTPREIPPADRGPFHPATPSQQAAETAPLPVPMRTYGEYTESAFPVAFSVGPADATVVGAPHEGNRARVEYDAVATPDDSPPSVIEGEIITVDVSPPVAGIGSTTVTVKIADEDHGRRHVRVELDDDTSRAPPVRTLAARNNRRIGRVQRVVFTRFPNPDRTHHLRAALRTASPGDVVLVNDRPYAIVQQYGHRVLAAARDGEFVSLWWSQRRVAITDDGDRERIQSVKPAPQAAGPVLGVRAGDRVRVTGEYLGLGTRSFAVAGEVVATTPQGCGVVTIAVDGGGTLALINDANRDGYYDRQHVDGKRVRYHTIEYAPDGAEGDDG